ncbi:EthD family reductase [Paucibacter sediminis]|uniref:EthD family reductase n=1 Tax=Paucibacter sediminis TaxID=3019553 RepID=A0AA95NFJ0_9BURK|nr:EthD family reductase [Paucibacter sp. S2-9]WIT13299.1 EthD family reductase [Paucibacter sp. S2-9]
MIRITGTYVWREGARFDHETYEREHMALTRELLTPLGLTRLEAERFLHPKGPRAGEPVAATNAYFASLEQAQAALAQAGAQLAAHVAQYTDLQPQLRLSQLTSIA